MKKIAKTLTLAPLILAAGLLAPLSAEAATGYTRGFVTVYAGPSGGYPSVRTIPRNTKIEVHGCSLRYDWCDVSFGRARGWVSADDISLRYRGRPVSIVEFGPRIHLPTISFEFDRYWGDHYRRNDFYRDRDSWRSRTFTARGDQDRDGVPNRLDRDRDGDGVSNNRDIAPNNPRIDGRPGGY